MDNGAWAVLVIVVIAAMVASALYFFTPLNPTSFYIISPQGVSSSGGLPDGNSAVPLVQTQETIPPNNGTLIFAVDDFAFDTNQLQSVTVIFDKLMLHNSQNRWVAVPFQPTTVNLLSLKDGNRLGITDASVPPGSYDSVWIELAGATVNDTNGNHIAFLPNNQIVFFGEVDVSSYQTTFALLDVISDKSLHVASDGTYIFAPAIDFNTWNEADVSISADNSVSFNSGIGATRVMESMDMRGNMGFGLNIPVDANLSIQDGQVVMVSTLAIPQLPRPPSGLAANPLSTTQIGLVWLPPPDTNTIGGYYIYRDGNLISSTLATSYTDSNILAGVSYNYAIADYDMNGNVSSQTPVISVSTSSSKSAGESGSSGGSSGGNSTNSIGGSSTQTSGTYGGGY